MIIPSMKTMIIPSMKSSDELDSSPILNVNRANIFADVSILHLYESAKSHTSHISAIRSRMRTVYPSNKILW